MTILTDESLEFARSHIQRYYDSDFYPKPFEFDAIWRCWPDVKRFLLGTNVYKLPVMPAKATSWPKPRGGYRVVHQLDPIDSVIYAALVYQVSAAIERARLSADRGVACAYRIQLEDGSFFAQGNGFDQYRNRSRSLAENYRFVLLVDVADFYNQIYLHRVNNAIEHASPTTKGLADDIEGFLCRLNSTISQGLPVGPAASIVLAEAVMIDVDQFLVGLGHPHCRYVDDFRIFANSEQDLTAVLQALTVYLYQHHRLPISHDKTRLAATEEFLRSDIDNPYEIQKAETFEKLDGLRGYGSPETTDSPDRGSARIDPKDIENAENTVLAALQAMVERKNLDLGYARALLRQARLLKSAKVAVYLLENVQFFFSLANNLCVFLGSVTRARKDVDQITRALEKALVEVVAFGGLVRYWFEWYIAENEAFIPAAIVRVALHSSPFPMSRARYAVLSNDLSWVRQRKSEYFQHGPEERRAVLYAAQILPNDEKEHWLKAVVAASLVPLERWVAEYIEYLEIDDDIPF